MSPVSSCMRNSTVALYLAIFWSLLSICSGLRFEILSGSWGGLDVTTTVQKNAIYSGNTVSLIASNSIYGDPLINSTKVLVVVWRIQFDDGTLYPFSVTQAFRIIEGNTLQYDFSTPPARYSPPLTTYNGIMVLDATYLQVDVTAQITTLNDGVASFNALTFTPGSSLFSITYGYIQRDGTMTIKSQTVREGMIVRVPPGAAPYVEIAAAEWANYNAIDITLPLISPSGLNWTIDTSKYPSSWYAVDPRPNIVKPLTVLYQLWYGKIEMLSTTDGSGVQTISRSNEPNANRTQYMNSAVPSASGRNIWAVFWGRMQNHAGPVADSVFNTLKTTGTIAATNAAIGFDGWPGYTKSLQVYYSIGSGLLKGAGSNEGYNVTLT